MYKMSGQMEYNPDHVVRWTSEGVLGNDRTPESSARGSPGELWQAEARFGPKTFGRGQILVESSSKILPKTFGLPANLPGPLSGVLVRLQPMIGPLNIGAEVGSNGWRKCSDARFGVRPKVFGLGQTSL